MTSSGYFDSIFVGYRSCSTLTQQPLFQTSQFIQCCLLNMLAAWPCNVRITETLEASTMILRARSAKLAMAAKLGKAFCTMPENFSRSCPIA